MRASIFCFVVVIFGANTAVAQLACSCPWQEVGSDIHNTNSGKVGIGTDSPARTLDVQGKIQLGKEDYTALLESNPLSLRFRLRNNTQEPMSIEYGSGLTLKELYTEPATFLIDAAGNVGIGTESPQEKLAVNGTVLAREVRVVNDPGQWPDFVFDDDYRVPALAEVHRFIEERGHLPGIPSASEVAENGVEVGAFQASLLQKVEELTLYLIDLEASNEELRRRVGQLEVGASGLRTSGRR